MPQSLLVTLSIRNLSTTVRLWRKKDELKVEVPVEFDVSDYCCTFFDALLTVHLSRILATDQLNAQILLSISFYQRMHFYCD